MITFPNPLLAPEPIDFTFVAMGAWCIIEPMTPVARTFLREKVEPGAAFLCVPMERVTTVATWLIESDMNIANSDFGLH